MQEQGSDKSQVTRREGEGQRVDVGGPSDAVIRRVLVSSGWLN